MTIPIYTDKRSSIRSGIFDNNAQTKEPSREDSEELQKLSYQTMKRSGFGVTYRKGIIN